MTTKPPSRPPHIVHIETGRHLYGGARQVLYLLEHLPQLHCQCTLVCAQGSEIANAARALGTTVHELPMRGDLDVAFAFRLAGLLKALAADLVHVHSRRGADVWGALGAKMAGVPALLSRRVDNPESAISVRLKYPLYRHVIAIADGIKVALVKSGVAAQQISVVRSAINPEPFKNPAHRAELLHTFGFADTPSALVLGIVAQLIARKGHAVLLHSMATLCREFPDLRLIIFGRGPLAAELQAQSQKLGLEPYVHFAGFRNDLSHWLGALDVLVHPAFMEGLGISLLQAGAAGVPIVAGRAGGIPEAVAEGHNAILVTPGSIEELTTALRRVLSDANLRQRMGAAGPTFISQGFTAHGMAAGNRAIYQQLLGI